MSGSMLFVYNRGAGKARIRSNLLDIIDVFVKAGYEVRHILRRHRGMQGKPSESGGVVMRLLYAVAVTVLWMKS